MKLVKNFHLLTIGVYAHAVIDFNYFNINRVQYTPEISIVLIQIPLQRY